MRGKLMFLGGLAAGFVLGTRAGREKYDEIVRAARRVRDNPTVQEAAGVVQEQASRAMAGGRDLVAEKLSHSRFADTPMGQKVLDTLEGDAGTGAERARRDAVEAARREEAEALRREEAMDVPVATGGTTSSAWSGTPGAGSAGTPGTAGSATTGNTGSAY